MKVLRLVGISKRIYRRVVLWVQEKWDPCWHGAKSRKIRVRTARKAGRRLAQLKSQEERSEFRGCCCGEGIMADSLLGPSISFTFTLTFTRHLLFEKRKIRPRCSSRKSLTKSMSAATHCRCFSNPTHTQPSLLVFSGHYLRSSHFCWTKLNQLRVTDLPPPPPPPDVLLGGTAFNGVVEELKNITTRVAHVLPVSDDGGSTAEIVRVLGNYSSVITSIVNAFGWPLIFFYLGMKLIIIYKFSDSKHCVQVENITSKNIFIF